jgi:protein-L-isoaspartate(D-aspartate) O-methyltransferase
MSTAADFFRRFMPGGTPPLEQRRTEMLARLRSGGIRDQRVLEAMAAVPREEFVTEGSEGDAYADRALPIGYRQTISQPLMVAIIVEALELDEGDRVLDVGTGSGYQAAVIARCGGRVVSIERIPRLAAAARSRLRRLDFDVHVVVGDGTARLPFRGPFDAIGVAAASPWPPPTSLLDALAPGGRLVIPVTHVGDGGGGDLGERLIRLRRVDDDDGTHFPCEDLGACRFVPLIGVQGYSVDMDE